VKQGFKIALQEFDFLVEQPSLQVLESSVRISDINSLREQLGFVANFVRHTQVWEIPDPLKSSELADSADQTFGAVKS
jgi:hypothetical protein